nr:immunoglobulin light chain junction region [Macaca mulatta]MOV74666.1 immunoglobulin light chain junction region [Macaca mulatta]MOV74828.1 immunoglobulin light chain junction region [Macaca mulatta]MOV75492.1 immunoglobulin light chain junction region [Macaca mulatta]MOV75893.1 immunoglobulin light chain junction region [Macaca mulatta]
CQQYNNYPYSF